jgi:hypothetical protein
LLCKAKPRHCVVRRRARWRTLISSGSNTREPLISQVPLAPRTMSSRRAQPSRNHKPPAGAHNLQDTDGQARGRTAKAQGTLGVAHRACASHG